MRGYECYGCDGDGEMCVGVGLRNCDICGGSGRLYRYCEMCDHWYGKALTDCPECGALLRRAEYDEVKAR